MVTMVTMVDNRLIWLLLLLSFVMHVISIVLNSVQCIVNGEECTVFLSSFSRDILQVLTFFSAVSHAVDRLKGIDHREKCQKPASSTVFSCLLQVHVISLLVYTQLYTWSLSTAIFCSQSHSYLQLVMEFLTQFVDKYGYYMLLRYNLQVQQCHWLGLQSPTALLGNNGIRISSNCPCPQNV